MNLLQGINSLLQLNIIWGELGLWTRHMSCYLIWRTAEFLTLSSAWPSCSLTYCCVRAANGLNEALYVDTLSVKAAVGLRIVQVNVMPVIEKKHGCLPQVLSEGRDLVHDCEYTLCMKKDCLLRGSFRDVIRLLDWKLPVEEHQRISITGRESLHVITFWWEINAIRFGHSTVYFRNETWSLSFLM